MDDEKKDPLELMKLFFGLFSNLLSALSDGADAGRIRFLRLVFEVESLLGFAAAVGKLI